MKKFLAICELILGTFCAHGNTTNVIDIAALAACGTGTTNGWIVSGIDSYTDRTSIRLNQKDEFLISPVFDSPIVEILFKAKSSAEAGRRLAVQPYINGGYLYEPSLTCSYSPTKDTYVPMIVTLGDNTGITSFKLALENNGDGSSTAWGVSELSVVTATPAYLSPPRNVTVGHIQPTSVRINWDSNESITSNLVTISEITVRTESYTVISDYDFELCVNTGSGDSADKSDDIAEKYPGLSGEKLYYPAASSGVIKMSTKDTNGRISHCGFPDYTDLFVEISAKRYPGDNTCTNLYVYYPYQGQESNPVEIGSVAISDEYTVGRVSLAKAPGGSVISFGNLGGIKSNRRYLIDRITFLKQTPSTITTTNVITTAVTSGESVFLAEGLTRKSNYIVTVAAIDAEGRMSEASTPIAFTTKEKAVGTLLTLR